MGRQRRSCDPRKGNTPKAWHESSTGRREDEEEAGLMIRAPSDGKGQSGGDSTHEDRAESVPRKKTKNKAHWEPLPGWRPGTEI